VIVALSLVSAMGGAPARADRPGALPNLVPLPPEIEFGDADPDTGLSAIRLSVAVANRGDAHLDLQGIPEEPSVEEAVAYQCVEWAQDRLCEAREPVGSFVWHPQHGHHHFEGFALYELRTLRKGRPNMRPRGLAAEGNKVSFCLIDYQRDDGEDTSLEGTGLGGWPLYSTCVVGSGYQGISKGWRDVYGATLDGQQVVVDGVPPGTYALVVTIDPDERLFETNDDDNVVALKVELDGSEVKTLCVFSPDFHTCGSPEE
jgi:hypothetical protein